MFISVIPISKSLGKHPYTYFVGETWIDQVVVGGLVEIPLGKHLITGLIASITDTHPEGVQITDIRPIHRVISSTPLITSEMISILSGLADRYFLLIHKALGLFLPAPLLSRLEKRNYVLSSLVQLERSDTQASETVIHHFISRTFSPSDLDTYMEEGTVIVFPSDMMLRVFMRERGKDDTLLTLSAGATATKKSQAWIDIYEGKYQIIVGTRRILYYNLSRYKKIIYLEDAFGHEHYQYPITIKSLDVLSLIEKNTHLDITIVTSSPSLDLFAIFPKAKIISKK